MLAVLCSTRAMSLDEMTSSRVKTSQNVLYRGCKWAVDLIATGHGGG